MMADEFRLGDAALDDHVQQLRVELSRLDPSRGLCICVALVYPRLDDFVSELEHLERIEASRFDTSAIVGLLLRVARGDCSVDVTPLMMAIEDSLAFEPEGCSEEVFELGVILLDSLVESLRDGSAQPFLRVPYRLLANAVQDVYYAARSDVSDSERNRLAYGSALVGDELARQSAVFRAVRTDTGVRSSIAQLMDVSRRS